MVSTADSHISQYNVHGSMLAANHQYVHGSTARYPGTIENVQKFALRVCSKSWSSDYATLLDTLSIPTLSDRRDTLKLCLLFNILTDRVTYPSCPTMLKHTPYANQHTNTVQLVVPRAHTNQFKYLFIPSTTERWNGLHFDANGITSLTSFKHALQHY